MASSTAVFRAVADFVSLNRAVKGARREISGLEKDIARLNESSSALDKSFGRLATTQNNLALSSKKLATQQSGVNKSFNETAAAANKSSTATSAAHKKLQQDISKTVTSVNQLTKAEKAATTAAQSHAKALDLERRAALGKNRTLAALVNNVTKLAEAEKAATSGARSHATALGREGDAARVANQEKRGLTKAVTDTARASGSAVGSHGALARAIGGVAREADDAAGALASSSAALLDSGRSASFAASGYEKLFAAFRRLGPGIAQQETSVRGLGQNLRVSGADAETAGAGFSSLSQKLGVFTSNASGSMRVISALRIVLYGLVAIGIGPAIQLVVGGLVDLVGALVAVTGAAAPMVGALGAIPTSLMAIGGALGTVKLAFAGLDKPMSALGKAMFGSEKQVQAFKKSLEGLPPPARRLLESIFALRPALLKLQQVAQNNMFPKFTQAIGILAPMLKSVATPAVAAFSTVIGNLAVRGAKMVRSFEGPLAQFFSTTGPQLVDKFGQTLINLGSTFISVGLAAQEFTKWAATGIESVTAGWAKSAEEGRKSGDLAKFFEEAKQSLILFGEVLGNVGSILGSVFGGAAPMGRELVTSFRDLTKSTADYLKTAEGQQKINEYFKAMKPNIDIIMRLFGKLGMALIKSGVSPALHEMLKAIENTLTPALSRFAKNFGKTMEEVGPLIINFFAKILDIASNLMELGDGGFIRGFIMALDALATVLEWLTSIPGVAQLVASLLALAGAMAAIKAIGALTGLSKLGRGLNSLAGGPAAVAQAGPYGRKGPRGLVGGFAKGALGRPGPEPRTGTARVGQAVGSRLRGAGESVGALKPRPVEPPRAPSIGSLASQTRKSAPGSIGKFGAAAAKNAGASAAIGNFAAAAKANTDAANKSSAAASSAYSRVGQAAQKAADIAKQSMQAAGKDIKNNYKAGSDAAKKFGADTGKSAEAATQKFSDKLTRAIDNTAKRLDGLPAKADRAMSAVGRVADRTGQALERAGRKEFVSPGRETRQGPKFSERAVTKGLDATGRAMGAAEEKVSRGISKINDGFQRMEDSATRAGQGVGRGMQRMEDGTTRAAQGVGRGMQRMEDRLVGAAKAVGPAWDRANKAVADGARKVQDVTKNGFQAAGRAVVSSMDSMERGVKNSISGINSGMDAMERRVMQVGPAVARGSKSATDAVKSIPTAFRSAALAAGQALQTLPQKMQATSTSVGNSVRNLGTSIQTGLTGAVQRIPSIVGNATSSLLRLTAPVAGVANTFRNVGTTISTGLQGGFTTALGTINRFKTTASTAISGVVSSVRSAASGLSGALGGPWGIAIAGAVTGLGLLADAQGKSAQKAAAHKQAIDNLRGTLDQYSGAVTQATVNANAEDIATRKLSDGKTQLTDAIKNAGISLSDFSAAASGNEAVLQKVNAQLIQQASTIPGLNSLYQGMKGSLDAAGVSFQDFLAAAVGNVGALERVAKATGMTVKQLESVFGEDKMGGQLREVGQALGGYTAKLKEAQEIQKGVAEGSKDFQTSLASLSSVFQGMEAAGQPVGQLKANLDALGVSAQQNARMAGDAILKLGGTPAQAAAEASKKMGEMRQAFIDAGMAAGNTLPFMENLANSIGLIPEKAALEFSTNAPQVVADLQKINAAITTAVAAGQKEVNIGVQTDAALQQLEAFNIRFTKLQDGTVVLNLEDKAAIAAFQQFIEMTKTASAIVNVDANVDPATGKINATVQLANGQQLKMQLDADTTAANGKIQGVVTLANGQTAQITIDANQTPVEGKIKAIVTLANGTQAEILLDANDKVTPLLEKFKNPPPITPEVKPGPTPPLPQPDPLKPDVLPNPFPPLDKPPPLKPEVDPGKILPFPKQDVPPVTPRVDPLPIQPGAIPPPPPVPVPFTWQTPGPPLPGVAPPGPVVPFTWQTPGPPLPGVAPPGPMVPFIWGTPPALPVPPPPGPMVPFIWGTPPPAPAPTPAPSISFNWGTPINAIPTPPAKVIPITWGRPTNTITPPAPVRVSYTITSNIDDITTKTRALSTPIATTHTITSNVLDIQKSIDGLKLPTESAHTVVDNVAQVAARIRTLQGMNTTSTHTIVTRQIGGGIPVKGGGVIPQYAGGGVQSEEPQGFAPGGVISGYSPGRDTVPAVLSPGEAVLVPELVRALGPRNIMEANQLASGRASGTSAADRARMTGEGPRFSGMSPIKGMAQILSKITGSALGQKFAKGGLVQKFAGGGAVADNRTTRYKVKPGDTLWSISKDHDSSPQAIIDANKKTVGENKTLEAGQYIMVPRYPQRPQDVPEDYTYDFTTGGSDVDDPEKFADLNTWMAEVARDNKERAEFERNVLQIATWGFDDLAGALVDMGVGDIHSSGSTSIDLNKKDPKADTTLPTLKFNFNDISDKTKSGLLLSRQFASNYARAADMEALLEQRAGMLNDDLGSVVKIIAALQKTVGLGIREVSMETDIGTDDLFKIMKKTAAKSQVQKLSSANNSKFLANLAAYERGEAFASGGRVFGTGNRDTVPAWLTPGEFVLRKDAVKAIGVPQLEKMNRADKAPEYAAGGSVAHAADLFSMVRRPTLSRANVGLVQKQVSAAVKTSSATNSSTNQKSVVFSEGAVQITNPAPARATDSFGSVMTKLSWSGTFS